jgi:Mlc titration factor MtfA (ptsG expression regulator)
MVPGVFPSPYAATSLREYFARGFEEYYMGRPQELKNICPVLYSKMYNLHNMED